MARLPFKASSARGGDDGARRRATSRGGTDGDRGLSVGEACRLIKSALEEGLPSTLRIEGEVSGLSNRNHWYFNLKDDEGVLQCVAWASAAAKFGFVPCDGELVVATGSITHYAPQGRTQFYVSRLEPLGTGALALRFKALCDDLRRRGYFDDAHKQPLPPMPRRIAVVTSATGAALRDVIDTAARRWPAVELLVIDVRVQGDGAAAQIAETIALVDRHAALLGVDAMLVTRGGGSIEDLWAFNEEVVATAAFRCRLPLVAAIGHESDTTVIELVADLRAATPTQAIMRLVPDRAELLKQIEQMRSRMALLLRRRLDVEGRRLDGLRRNELLRRPQAILQRHREWLHGQRSTLRRLGAGRVAAARRDLGGFAARLRSRHPRHLARAARQRLTNTQQRFVSAIRSRLQRRRQELEGLARALRAVDPHAIVARGYSITTLEDGRLLRDVADAPMGSVLVTQVRDGRVRSVVDDSAGGGTSADPTTKPEAAGQRRDNSRRLRRKAASDAASMDLFGGGE